MLLCVKLLFSWNRDFVAQFRSECQTKVAQQHRQSGKSLWYNKNKIDDKKSRVHSKEAAAATAASFATKLRNKTNERTNDNVKLHDRERAMHTVKSKLGTFTFHLPDDFLYFCFSFCAFFFFSCFIFFVTLFLSIFFPLISILFYFLFFIMKYF